MLPPAFSPIIRGRDAELAAVGDLLGRVRSGSGAVLLIGGAAGMGKSRLIGEGVRMAQRWASVAVGIGAADPWESVAELAPLLQGALRRTRTVARSRRAGQPPRRARAALLAAAGAAVAARGRGHGTAH